MSSTDSTKADTRIDLCVLPGYGTDLGHHTFRLRHPCMYLTTSTTIKVSNIWTRWSEMSSPFPVALFLHAYFSVHPSKNVWTRDQFLPPPAATDQQYRTCSTVREKWFPVGTTSSWCHWCTRSIHFGLLVSCFILFTFSFSLIRL